MNQKLRLNIGGAQSSSKKVSKKASASAPKKASKKGKKLPGKGTRKSPYIVHNSNSNSSGISSNNNSSKSNILIISDHPYLKYLIKASIDLDKTTVSQLTNLINKKLWGKLTKKNIEGIKIFSHDNIHLKNGKEKLTGHMQDGDHIYIELETKNIYKWPGNTNDNMLIMDHAQFILNNVKSGGNFSDIYKDLVVRNNSLPLNVRINYAKIYKSIFSKEFAEMEEHLISGKPPKKWMEPLLSLLDIKAEELNAEFFIEGIYDETLYELFDDFDKMCGIMSSEKNNNSYNNSNNN